MNGLQEILDFLDKTQRTKASLINCPEPSDEKTRESPPPQYASPQDCPRTKTCHCGKISGTINNAQREWCNDILKRSRSTGVVNMWNHCPLPRFDSPPQLRQYILKPLHIFSPQHQYSIDVESRPCPHCGTRFSLRFKEFSAPRHVEGLHTDFYTSR